MMMKRGHTTICYGAEGGYHHDEHIQVISRAEQEAWFGPWNKNDTYATQHEFFHQSKPWWRLMAARTVAEILTRKQAGDFLCLIMGSQREIADWLPDMKAVEYGVGYFGTFSKYRCFESESHRACVWGQQQRDPDGSWTDWVIPNYYDPEEFPITAMLPREERHGFAFLGRLNRRKGLQLAIDTADALGQTLTIAGQGMISWNGRELATRDGTFTGGKINFIGHVDPVQRAKLLGSVRAVFVPTLYVEPFGGVNVEAQLMGTPVLTTAFGAFPETVEHGKTGYLCRDPHEFIANAERLGKLESPEYIRKRALSRYAMSVVGEQFEAYFQFLQTI